MYKIQLIALLLIAPCFSSAQTQKTWKLVWADEFDYTGLPDSSKWGYDVWPPGRVNQEKQEYLYKDTSTVYASNGVLRIKVGRIIKDGDTSYTSARLVTKNKGDWKYGKIEVRAKVASGRGLCSAVWMFPSEQKYGGWPHSGEIDIMEHIDWDIYRDTIFQTVHTGSYNHVIGNQKGKKVFVKNPSADFHIYTIEWTPEYIDYILDDIHTFRVSNEHKTTDEWPFNIPFFLIMNISVGGKWEGAKGIDPTIFPATMLVDYVRVYQ